MSLNSFALVVALAGTATVSALAAPTPAWNAGDRVFAKMADEIYSYPATVIGPKNKGFEILYDAGGKRAESPAADLSAIDLKIGSLVYGNWQKRGAFYAGTVTAKTDEQIRIQYEDGDQEMATIGNVRVVRGKVDVACVEGEAVYAAIDTVGTIFYPVTIQGKENERIRVRAGGTTEILIPANLTRALHLAKGDRVLARWQNGPTFFPGRVNQVTKERVEIAYDDGDMEWTSAGLVMLLPGEAKKERPFCLDRTKDHAARKTPLELAPLPAAPRGPGKNPQSI